MKNVHYFLILSILFVSGCTQATASKGWKYLKHNRPYKAIEVFKRSAKTETPPEYFLGMYYAYTAIDNLSRAEYALLEGLENHPNDFYLNYAAGQLYLRDTYKYNQEKAFYHIKKCQEMGGPDRHFDVKTNKFILDTRGDIKAQ